MGVRASMLVYTDTTPTLPLVQASVVDRVAARQFASQLHPRRELRAVADGNLSSNCFPEPGRIYAGVFPGVKVLCTAEAMLYSPSKLHKRFISAAQGGVLHLFVTRSLNNMFAYASWIDGQLLRSISVNAIGGVVESVGSPLPFEEPFWAGNRREEGDTDQIPFHPLTFMEDAAGAVLGLHFEGMPLSGQPDPEEVCLAGFDVLKTDASSPPRDQSWREGVDAKRRANEAAFVEEIQDRGFSTARQSDRLFYSETLPDVRFGIGATHIRFEKRVDGKWRLWESYLLTSETHLALQILDDPTRRLTRRQ